MKKKRKHIKLIKTAKKKHHGKRKYTPEQKLKIGAVFILVVAVAAFLTYDKPSFPAESINPFGIPYDYPLGQPEIIEIYHMHADFLVVVNGKNVSFDRREFDFVNPAIHIHVQNFAGDRVMHIESRDAVLYDFFSSLDMAFNSTCFSVDGGEYCNNSTHSIKLFVNGMENKDFENYQPKDLDRILVIYGSESDVQEQIDSVTAWACVFSEKCAPPPEAENKILYN